MVLVCWRRFAYTGGPIAANTCPSVLREACQKVVHVCGVLIPGCTRLLVDKIRSKGHLTMSSPASPGTSVTRLNSDASRIIRRLTVMRSLSGDGVAGSSPGNKNVTEGRLGPWADNGIRFLIFWKFSCFWSPLVGGRYRLHSVVFEVGVG